MIKMNRDSANMGGLLPITLRFSHLVSDVLREVPADQEPQPKYTYSMSPERVRDLRPVRPRLLGFTESSMADGTWPMPDALLFSLDLASAMSHLPCRCQ